SLRDTPGRVRLEHLLDEHPAHRLLGPPEQGTRPWMPELPAPAVDAELDPGPAATLPPQRPGDRGAGGGGARWARRRDDHDDKGGQGEGESACGARHRPAGRGHGPRLAHGTGGVKESTAIAAFQNPNGAWGCPPCPVGYA